MDDDRKGKDQLALGPDLGGGLRPFIRHLPDHQLTVGLCSPIVEGRPTSGDLVRIKESEHEGVFDVESLYEPNRRLEGSGPSNVNSKAYLSGWDRIFGGKTVVGSA